MFSMISNIDPYNPNGGKLDEVGKIGDDIANLIFKP